MPDPNLQPVDTNTMIDQSSGAAPSAPASTAVNGAPQTSPLSPAPTPTPAPATQKPHPLAHALDAVLKQATGGDVYYTDPQGQRKLAPQSRGTLGKTLIAATLAGLLAPDKYRQTPYGPATDWNGTAASAVGAATAKTKEMRNRPQQLSDEAQTRKMMTLQNNSNLIALQSAQARLANEENDYKVKTDAHVQEMLTPFTEYENDRTANNDPNQPKAFVDGGRGLSHEQAMQMIQSGKAKGLGYTENNIIQDGWSDVWDAAANRMVPEPTYAILNPALKDAALPKNVTDILAKINSQYKDIHSIVGGTVRVPVNAYVSAMHDYQAVQTGRVALDRLSKELGGKGVTLEEVEKAARDGRDNKTDILTALYGLTHAVAGGQMPDQRPDNLLHVLQNSKNGSDVLALLGLSPAEAQEKMEGYKLARESKEALAKEGGIGDKAPADPDKVAALPQLAESLGLTKPQVAIAVGKPNKAGMTNGEYRQAVDKIQAQANENEKQALQAGSDDQLTKMGNRSVFENDLSSLNQVLSQRQNVRLKASNIIHDIAQQAGVDTSYFTPAALQAKADAYKDFSGDKKGSTGQQIASFNALLGHTANAVDAAERLKGKTFGIGNSPIWNTAMDVVGKQAANDPDWKTFKTSLIPVQTEISNFLAAGYAVKEHDAALMNQVLDPHETPERIAAALRSIADTSDVRLREIGQRYLSTTNTTYRDLLTPDSINTLKRLGIKSKSADFAGTLPSGWAGTQPQTMTDPRVAQAYAAAAGNDPAKTQRLARDHGWILN